MVTIVTRQGSAVSSMLGELPFKDNSDPLSILYVYLSTSLGQEIGLPHCSSRALEKALSKISIKFLRQYRFKLIKAEKKHDIMFIYKIFLLSCVAKIYVRITMTNHHIRNAEESKKNLKDILSQ